MEKLELIKLASELTGKRDISELASAANEIEKYLLTNEEKSISSQLTTETKSEQNLSFLDFLTRLKLKNPHGDDYKHFEVLPYHYMLNHYFQNNKFILINAARQIGLSTTLCAYALWFAKFNRNKNIVISNSTYIQQLMMFDLIRSMINTYSIAFDNCIREYCKGRIGLTNGSRIVGRSATRNTTIGWSTDLLIVDNAAFIPYSFDNEMFHNMLPSLTTNGQVLMCSTPGYDKGLFYDSWIQENKFVKLTIPSCYRTNYIFQDNNHLLSFKTAVESKKDTDK